MNVYTLNYQKMKLVLVYFPSVFTNIDCVSFCCLCPILCYFVSSTMYLLWKFVSFSLFHATYSHCSLCLVCWIAARWGHLGDRWRPPLSN